MSVLCFDFTGNMTSFTDGNGHTMHYVYDTRFEDAYASDMDTSNVGYHSRLVAITDAVGATTQYGYDGLGNVTSVTPIRSAGDEAGSSFSQNVMGMSE